MRALESGSGQGTPAPAQPDRRFWQNPGFWLGPFSIGIGILVGVLVGAGWYMLGGFPRDHDAYATIPIPGQAVVNLPEGDVRINFENDAHRSGDSTIIDDQPEGLEVVVTPAAGGEPLEVEDVPSWLFGSTTNDRGHEPFGKTEIPS